MREGKKEKLSKLVQITKFNEGLYEEETKRMTGTQSTNHGRKVHRKRK